jgi:hypothetical protein
VFPLFSFFSLPSFLQFCLFLAGFMPSCSYPLTSPRTFDPYGICMLRACMCRSLPKILGGAKKYLLEVVSEHRRGRVHGRQGPVSISSWGSRPTRRDGELAPHCTPRPCMLRACMYIHTPCPRPHCAAVPQKYLNLPLSHAKCFALVGHAEI